MVRLKSIVIILGLILLSCNETREDKISKYFQNNGIIDNVAIGILNPNHCGSCTDYSITWLCKKDIKNKKKIILLTDELKVNYKKQLTESGYTFASASTEELSRIGITLAACTYVEMENDEVIKIEIIK